MIPVPGFSGPLKRQGFSFLELITVMAIISVLLVIALPGYQRYTQRSHRAEAIGLMLEIAGCQARVWASRGFYDTTRCMEGSTSGAHEIRLEPADNVLAAGFSIFAEPRSNSDEDCGILSLDHTGTRGISGSQEQLARCWGGR